MALVILAREPLDDLQRLVEAKFGRLPRGTGPRNPAVAPTALVPPTNGLRPALLVAPVRAARRLALSWRVPYAGDVDAARRAEIRSKAGSIIASVLGDEGAGSLLSWTRGENYAAGISASASPDGSSGLRLDIAYELTSKGLNFWPDLVAATVGAVAKLRATGVPRYRVEELDQLAELSWRYSEPGGAGDVAKGLVTNVQEVGWDDGADDQRRILSLFRRRGAGAGSSTDAQLDATRQLLETGLVLENLCLTVVAREFLREDSYWPQLAQRERWYGTAYEPYAFDGASIAQLQKLRAPPRGTIVAPRLNPYLPRDLRLRAPPPEPRPPPTPLAADDPTAPQPLAVGGRADEMLQASFSDVPGAIRWSVSYSTDREFGRPRGAVFATARVGAVGESPESYVLALLWRLACLDDLRERLWPARTAGLQYALDIGPRGVSLPFSGYSDGLAALARDVSQSAAKFVPDEASTARLADVIRRDLQDKSKPYVAAGFAATRALTRDGAFADQALVRALDAIFADGAAGATARVRQFARDHLWAGGRPAAARGGDILVEGNLDKKEARALAASIATALPLRLASESSFPTPRGLALPTTPVVLRIGAEEIGTERNSAAELLLPVGTGPRAVALASVLSALLKPLFFDALRTKEQLGYVVQLGQRALPGATRPIALVLLVQGESSPQLLTRRMRKFVTTEASAAVKSLDETTLRGIASSLADQKLEGDRRLYDRSGRHWEEIRRTRDAAIEGAARAPTWNRRYQTAAALNALTLADVRDLWTDIVAGGSFVVEAWGRDAPSLVDAPADGATVARSADEVRAVLKPLDSATTVAKSADEVRAMLTVGFPPA